MIALALSLAFGQVDPQSEAVRLAEYQRLSESLHSYAARQAWPAVEQAYVRCEATGAPMSMADHLQGAYSARMRGDITAVRKRLLAILALGTDRDAIEWLWSIDQTYSAVTIKGYPGAELIPRERPFDPIQGLSIDFAAKALAETGRFEGLLPRGAYIAGDTPFELRMGSRDNVVEALPPTTGKKKKGRAG